MRSVKFPIVEVGGVIKEYELDKVQSLPRPITEISERIVVQLLVIQICSRGGKVFQRSTHLYQIVCGIRRFMVEKNPAIEFNPLDSSDKRCVNWLYWRVGLFDIFKVKEIASNFSLSLIRFAIFRRIWEAEMKDGTRVGVGLKAKRKE